MADLLMATWIARMEIWTYRSIAHFCTRHPSNRHKLPQNQARTPPKGHRMASQKAKKCPKIGSLPLQIVPKQAKMALKWGAPNPWKGPKGPCCSPPQILKGPKTGQNGPKSLIFTGFADLRVIRWLVNRFRTPISLFQVEPENKVHLWILSINRIWT